MSKFKELLQASMKSKDTEEWIDVYFTRPIGLVFALIGQRFGVHPNTITILSMFLGVGAGYCFYFTNLYHNLLGILLLVLANLCDSADGQLARLTNQRSIIGRLLDGIAGEVWFIAIYVAIALRLDGQEIPGTDMIWGIGIWTIAAISGFLCHSEQSSLADYYRQIHLFFLKGKTGSELDNAAQQEEIYQSLDKNDWLKRLFHGFYTHYCSSQERRTPQFQAFFKQYQATPNKAIQQQFLSGSRPLMPLTNVLSFNTRAIVLYISCIANHPWAYFLFEIAVLQLVRMYMFRRHEALCKQLKTQMQQL